MSPRTTHVRAAKLLAFAKRKARRAQDWTELHNAVYGIGGKLIELFPAQKDRLAFMRTDEAKQVNGLIEKLQSKVAPTSGAGRQSGTVIVRLPASIHTALAAEAEAEGTSLNQLCLAKLAVQLRAITG